MADLQRAVEIQGLPNLGVEQPRQPGQAAPDPLSLEPPGQDQVIGIADAETIQLSLSQVEEILRAAHADTHAATLLEESFLRLQTATIIANLTQAGPAGTNTGPSNSAPWRLPSPTPPATSPSVSSPPKRPAASGRSPCSTPSWPSSPLTEHETLLSKFNGEEGLAEAQAIVDGYEAGRLGSPEDVKADMEPYFTAPGRPLIPIPFGSDGHFLPLEQFTDPQAAFFNIWRGRSRKLFDALGPEIRAARQRVVDAEQGDDPK